MVFNTINQTKPNLAMIYLKNCSFGIKQNAVYIFGINTGIHIKKKHFEDYLYIITVKLFSNDH